MKEELRELYKYRELLYMIAYRDIKVRYKQSIMGFLWAILMPVLIVMSGVVVRYAYALSAHAPLQTADIASVAVKSLPWAFLVSSIRFSCNSLISNKDLVTKIYFPKEIFPIAAVMASLFDFFVASGALVIFLLVIQIGWSAYLVWIPVLLADDGCSGHRNRNDCIRRQPLLPRREVYCRSAADVRNLLHSGLLRRPHVRRQRQMAVAQSGSPDSGWLSACIARHQSPDLPWLAYSLVFAW